MSVNNARTFVEKLRQDQNFRKKVLVLVVCILLSMSCSLVYAGIAMAPGSTLPEFKIEMPTLPEMSAYLGIKGGGAFSLSQIPADLIVVEFFSIFCPKCHQNAPIANQLYRSIKKDKELSKNIKMIGIGLASKSKEIAVYKEKFKVEFPLFADPQKKAKTKSKVKRVPLTILIDKSGKVLMSHLGVIKNLDAFLGKIRKHHKTLEYRIEASL
ncbi:MAG: TlpA disulfide reductase family protein [Deltaproteobacteria bacterium]